MLTRRQLIGGIASVIVAQKAPAYIIKSLHAARSTSFIEDGGHDGPIPYVTNGLVAYWDGIWNVDFDLHDDYSSIWHDLVGGIELTKSTNTNIVWTPTGLNSLWAGAGAYVNMASGTFTPVPDALCCQIFISGDTSGNLPRVVGSGSSLNLISKSNGKYSFFFSSAGFFDGKGDGNCRVYDIGEGNVAPLIYDGLTITMNYSSVKPKYADEFYLNDSLIAYTGTAWGGGTSAIFIGGNSAWQANQNTIYSSIRLYSRNLSQPEVSFNHSVDMQRFFN